ncbi:MAG: cytochrome c biogenesis protein CcsA [Chitinophagaceae bacterium]|nr:cytochrome c biogenesis protein CcsA [Chitinophagaceae bacterium]MCW5927088.1 cytochrome c biogenesis protein CcsA [Chitinophagaceae bacterium]
MGYQGEHLFVGQLGHFCAVLSFVASLVATFAYFKATQTAAVAEIHAAWKKLARTAFIIETVAVATIMVALYIILYNHYFEYRFAYQHSNRSLPVNYLISSFWEGQEGSFMLWNLWHCIIGLVLIKTGKVWEAPVMTILSVAQIFMSTFLLGVYFFDVKIGSSPFVLMRNEYNYPIFKDPLYIQKALRDGQGLNILLQNYWMVIHPPIVFIGFASSIVPFAFAIAGLWTKKYHEWIKPVLPWALFNAAFLGIGIMMGAAWAYESLTFGGYWAWDPVENASLVPWLIIIAAIHIMLLNRSTGYSSRSVFWFTFLSFLTLIYSTFLTRTGVLGDTSVHSFTGDGNSLFWHFLVIMSFFSALFAVLYFKNRKHLPVVKKEEDISSREFWMFVGALVFLISSAYITFYTSLPLINKIFGSQMAIGEDPEYVYNRVMILIAVVLGLLTAIVQYLKYKHTPRSFWLKKIAVPTVIAVVISLLISLFGNINYMNYGAGYLGAIHLAIFAAVYAMVANTAYIWVGLNGKMKSAGGSIAHFGFGLLLLGILISSSKKEVISINRTGIVFSWLKDPKGRDDSGLQNVTLIQGVPTPLGKYVVTYSGDTSYPRDEKRYFKIHYVWKDSVTNTVKEEFTLYPNAFLIKGEDGRTQLSANPDSRHYWNKDIFTFVTSMPDPESVKDTATFRHTPVFTGDTVFYSSGYITIDQLIKADKGTNKDLPLVDSAWLADVTVHGNNGMTFKANPALFSKDGTPIPKRDTIMAQSLVLEVNKNGEQIELGVKESGAVMNYITLKAFQFPYINLLWMGVLVTSFGTLMSAWQRAKRN